MFELTIKGEVYSFQFGMGFLREINKKMSTPVDGVPDAKQNVGLRFALASVVIDKDIEALVDMLFAANKGQNPRVTPALLDGYIDDESTDIDALFEDVIGFLKSANATKLAAAKVVEQYEEALKKQNQ